MKKPIEEMLESIEKQNLEILHFLKGDQSHSTSHQNDKSAKLLTKTEYAKAIKKSVPTVDRWVSDGLITPILIGGRRYFQDPVSQYISK
ncbi:MerR family transcriptional regulator [Epilithonimonas tenax]|uniref:helix-turn-helix domain-containing protein n=1 Tax=Epilithonimonas tenax TaxID=191577 RepID=UPI0004813A47|nr:helix-turn-helix domain-containing protein [Epilithonimonas tenax]